MIYVLIGCATALENIFPPTPSDVMVALGGLLAHRGVTKPITLFLVAWGSSMAGAVTVYLAARRYGPGFFSGRLGRRLLSPASIAAMEREYLRLGVVGIFISRILPGFRSFVAPFAGLVRLPPLKAAVPIALASGVWYAFLTYLGVRLGAEWEAIKDALSHLNRGLAIVAGLALVALITWVVIRRRQMGRDRLWKAIRLALRDDWEAEQRAHSDPAAAGAATLLLELAQTDQVIQPSELGVIEAYLRDRWGLMPGVGRAGAQIGPAQQTVARALSSRVVQRYDRPARLDLVERLWRVLFSDGVLSPHEDRLMQRAGDLLGLTEEDLAEARRRVQP